MFDIHKALASSARRNLILSLAERDKYVTELAKEIDKTPQTIDFHLGILCDLGLVEIRWKEGKKYYSLKDKKILKYLRERRPIPPEFGPKPPHEIMMDAWEDIADRLDHIDAKLDQLLKKKS